MLRPVLHFDGPDNISDRASLRVRGSYPEILTMIEIITKELCLKDMDPDDIMLAVVNGIREAKK